MRVNPSSCLTLRGSHPRPHRPQVSRINTNSTTDTTDFDYFSSSFLRIRRSCRSDQILEEGTKKKRKPKFRPASSAGRNVESVIAAITTVKVHASAASPPPDREKTGIKMVIDTDTHSSLAGSIDVSVKGRLRAVQIDIRRTLILQQERTYAALACVGECDGLYRDRRMSLERRTHTTF